MFYSTERFVKSFSEILYCIDLGKLE